MGHHIDDEGRFQSDKHKELEPDHVVIDLTDPEAWAGLQVIAASYKVKDGGFADDLQARVTQLQTAHIDPKSSVTRMPDLGPKGTLKGTLT